LNLQAKQMIDVHFLGRNASIQYATVLSPKINQRFMALSSRVLITTLQLRSSW
jgi:hypothetical protein